MWESLFPYYHSPQSTSEAAGTHFVFQVWNEAHFLPYDVKNRWYPMETILRYLCLLLLSAGVDIVPPWRRLSHPPPPPGLAALPLISQPWRSPVNENNQSETHVVMPPPRSPLQLLLCILPSFPVFHGCTSRMEQMWKMINNIRVIGTLASDAIDLLSSAEDRPLHWTARWKSVCFSRRFWLFKFRFDENWSNAAVWKRSIVHALTRTMCFE